MKPLECLTSDKMSAFYLICQNILIELAKHLCIQLAPAGLLLPKVNGLHLQKQLKL